MRLLDLLPPLLSPTVRFELIRKLRLHCIRRSSLAVRTEPERWREAVQPAVEELISRSRGVGLPEHVTSVATWLTDNDARAAQQLLAQAEQEEARVRTQFLAQEFSRIEALLVAYAESRAKLTHTISLPQGEIRVTIAHRINSLGNRLGAFLRRLWS